MMKKKSILIIDDEETFSRPFAKILEHEGYSADIANNGHEAIKKLNAQSYDLAFIDIRLPDMQGTELLPTMKETTPKMIKIVITGYSTPENQKEAFKKGADDYLIKPIRIDDFLKTIKEHLQLQEDTVKREGGPKSESRHALKNLKQRHQPSVRAFELWMSTLVYRDDFLWKIIDPYSPVLDIIQGRSTWNLSKPTRDQSQSAPSNL